MISFIVSLLVTGIVLVKMLFSDLSGGNSVVDGVREGAAQGKEIHDAITSALNGELDVDKEQPQPTPDQPKQDEHKFTP